MKQARRKERRRTGRRKGQFFILGAVLICAVFFVGLPLYGPQIQSYREDLPFLSRNLESEFPKAFNLALESGGGIGSLADFSRFAVSALAGQNVQARILWVVSGPEGSGVAVTVGNFMGQEQSVTITVNGIPQTIAVQDNSTQSMVFSAPDYFQVQADFPGHSRTSTWIRNKADLYAYLELSRGADIAVKEIEG